MGDEGGSEPILFFGKEKKKITLYVCPQSSSLIFIFYTADERDFMRYPPGASVNAIFLFLPTLKFR